MLKLYDLSGFYPYLEKVCEQLVEPIPLVSESLATFFSPGSETNKPVLTELKKDISNSTLNTVDQSKEIIKDVGVLASGILGAMSIGAAIGALVGAFALPLPVLGSAVGAGVGALLGAGAGFALTGLQGLIRGRLTGGQNPTAESVAAGTLTALGVTIIGVIIGTILFPGIGTAIGAGIGAFIGLLPSVAKLVQRGFKEKDVYQSCEDYDSRITMNHNPYTHPDLVPIFNNPTSHKIIISEDESSDEKTPSDLTKRVIDNNITEEERYQQSVAIPGQEHQSLNS